MSQHHSPREYLDEAKSPATSPERLDLLAKTEWEFVRAAMAANPNTTIRTLMDLIPTNMRAKDEAIAVAIARRTHAPSDALRELARRYGQVNDWTGRNVNFELGLSLLSNPATPDDAVQALLDPARSTAHFRGRMATTTTRRDVLLLLSRDVAKKSKNGPLVR